MLLQDGDFKSEPRGNDNSRTLAILHRYVTRMSIVLRKLFACVSLVFMPFVGALTQYV